MRCGLVTHGSQVCKRLVERHAEHLIVFSRARCGEFLIRRVFRLVKFFR